MKGTTILLLSGAALLGSWLWSKKVSPEHKQKMKDVLRKGLKEHLPSQLKASV